MSSISKRIDWADALKGLLILLVILGHSIQSVCIQRGGDFLSNYLWNLIYSFHMPAFMAISGFLSYRPNKKGILILSIYRRLRQLIIPFIMWSVLMFVVNHNVGHIFDYILYPNYSFWFLWALFFIVVIFNIVDYLSERIHLRQELAIIGTASILLVLRFVLPDAKLIGFEYVSYYFVYYIMAYYLHKYSGWIPQKSKVLFILALAWFFLGSFYVATGVPSIVCWISIVPVSILNITYRVITATIFIIMMLGLGGKITIGKNKIWRYIIEFGNISLGVYVVHMVLRVWLVRLLDCMLPWCPNWVLMAVTFVLLSILSLWIVRLLGKWKITAIWLLGKV